MPTADIAVIGGGIVGTSIAWHLARRGGGRRIALVEKQPLLGAGSTAKAAGGIRAQFSSEINCRLSALSLPAFERFAADMRCGAVFTQAGYLFLATRPEEVALFRRNVELERRHGFDVRLVDPPEIARLAPYVRLDDVLAGSFHPRDGYAPPAEYVEAYARQARKLGVEILAPAPVTGLRITNGALAAVETTAVTIETRTVIIAAGAYTPVIGKMAGLDIPIQPVRREVFVTHPLPSLPHPIPMTIDYTTGLYLHSESGGVLMGMANRAEPPGFNEAVDWDFLPVMVEAATRRVPALADAEILRGWAGLYEVTPDNHPIIGPVPGVAGLWLCAGFSGHGFMHAPAAGQLMSEWLIDGKPSIDLAPLRLSRFAEGKAIQETNVI